MNSDMPPMLVLGEDDDDPSDAAFMGQGNLPNGAPTGNTGPCNCGYKHWCDGKEYDYVFRLPNPEKGVMVDLGVNHGGRCYPFVSPYLQDNPILVAEAFLLRHGIGKAFYSNNLVSEIAQKIREHLVEASAGSSTVSSNKPATLDEDEIFKSSMQVSY